MKPRSHQLDIVTMLKANMENYGQQKTTFPWNGASIYEPPELSSNVLSCVLSQSDVLLGRLDGPIFILGRMFLLSVAKAYSAQRSCYGTLYFSSWFHFCIW